MSFSEVIARANAAAADEDETLAIQLYTEALKLTSTGEERSDALAKRAALRLRGRCLAEALADTTAALEAVGGEANASAKLLLRHGEVLQALGRDAEAKRAFEASLALEPTNAKTQRFLEALAPKGTLPTMF